MRIPLWLKVIPVYAIIMVMLGFPFMRVHALKQRVTTIQSTIRDKPTLQLPSEVPQRVIIPAGGIDLPIVVGVTDATNHTWEVQDGAANLIPPSATAPGRTVLYAHDRSYDFHAIHNLAAGDIAYVQTKHYLYSYRYDHAVVVAPTDTSILTSHAYKPELVLITCEGLWSNNRYVVYLTLEAVK